jgi:hypothetical protein
MIFNPTLSITNIKKVAILSNIKAIFVAICLFLVFMSKISANTQTMSIKDFVKETTANIPLTSSDFSSQYLDPMLSDAKMKTPNGTEFDAALMCKSSNAFLEIFGKPGTTGDLTYLQIRRDTNLDGKFDSVSTLPRAVSGVCANGIISCNHGTWDNCVGYKWNADNDNLKLIETGIGNLGGCYCINESCVDSSLSTRILSSIIKDIGSSAAQEMANTNPQYMISNAVVNGPTAKFYGQKLEGCSNGNINQLASYRNNPSIIENEANNLKTDNDGIYQLIANSGLATDNLTTLRSCEVNRNITEENIKLDDIITYNGGTGGVHRCSTPGCLELVLGRVGDNYWGGWCSIKHQKVSFYVDMPERINKAVLIRAKYDDWIRVGLNDQKIWAHPYSDWDGQTIGGRRCEWSTSWNKRPNIDFTSLLKNKGKADFTIDVQVAGGGEGYAYAQIFVDESCKIGSEYITNQCETIEQDEKCELKNEWVDSVQTYKNFHPTGKSPLATTRDIGGCGLEVTRNWWNIKREYECRVNHNFDFSEGIARNRAIKQSATNSQYNDLIGGVSTIRSLDISNITDNTKNCTNACKVKRVKEGSTVTSDGTKSTTGTEFETLYRKCTGDSQNICPNGQDETIINQCGCLNEFGEVSSMMNAMRYAAQDLICTTGDPKGF